MQESEVGVWGPIDAGVPEVVVRDSSFDQITKKPYPIGIDGTIVMLKVRYTDLS